MQVMFKARRFGSCCSQVCMNRKLSEALCSKRVGSAVGSNVHKFDLKLSEALCRLCLKRVGSDHAVHKFE